MSATLLQSITVGKGMPQELKQHAHRTGEDAKAKKQGFMKLLAHLMVKPSKGKKTAAKSGKLGMLVSSKAQDKVASLFLKLKVLVKELKKNPHMGKVEKQQLILRLQIKGDLDELNKLSIAERLDVFNWLKQKLGLLEDSSTALSDDSVKLAEKIAAWFDSGNSTEKGQLLTTDDPDSTAKNAPKNNILAAADKMKVNVTKKTISTSAQGTSAKTEVDLLLTDKGENGVKANNSSGTDDNIVMRSLKNLFGLTETVAAASGEAAVLVGKNLKKTSSHAKKTAAKNTAIGESSEKQSLFDAGNGEEKSTTETQETKLFEEKFMLLTKPKSHGSLLKKTIFKGQLQKQTGDQAENKSESTTKQLLNVKVQKLEVNQPQTKQSTTAKELAQKSTVPDPHKVVDQVVKTVKTEIGPGVSKIEIQLEPKHLGKVKVSIVMENNKLSAKLTTQNVMAKEVLQQNLNQLKEVLQSQGIEVEYLNVNIGYDSEQKFAFQQENNKSSAAKNRYGGLNAMTDEDTNAMTFSHRPQLISTGRVDYLI